MMSKVILDSNFLMLFGTFRGDLFRELDNIVGRRVEKIILKPIYDELQKISLIGNSKTRKQALAALKIIDMKESTRVDIKLKQLETVDELIIRVAEMWKCLVATNDGELRKKLIKIGAPVIYLRQRNRLEVKGYRG
ncbi:MAG: 30S processome protein Utp24 [Candidatus Bathyarchaeota archaeon]|nr:MAG: 30S processome protein Utp24 [Candidatus Bathyarchaeota archaeon]